MSSENLNRKPVSLKGIIEVVAFGTLVLSVATIFDGYHRFIELFSHFKVLYLVTSLMCAFILLAIRSYRSAMVAILVVFLNALFVIPWYFPSPENREDNIVSTIKLMHSNVHTSNQNYQLLIDLVLAESPSIVLLQEINAKWMSQLEILDDTYPYRFASPREDNFGIAIFSKYPFDDIKREYWGDSNVPSIKAVITVSGKQFTTIATHPLPPISTVYYNSRNSQINAIAKVAVDTELPLILVGDLNVTMWSGDYAPLELDTNLRNARKGFGVLPTWPSMFPIAIIPIDHFLVTPHFSVMDLKVGSDIGSDHLPLIIELGIKA